ncbi:hypothetical protein [Nocardioides jensenii]|uniref:hypothetical protein n=1 Tax=Nocardioides jensenii TaxID=1843 RepID=UPI001C3F4D59|nr:hypothetical protein [Nocardioides jensenii]
MLRRALLALLLATGAVVFLGHQAAYAECSEVYNPETGEFELDCSDDGADPVGGDPDTGGSSTCTNAGSEIPCTGPNGSAWSSAHGCYVGAVWDPGGEGDQPPPGETKKDGGWHICYFPPPGSSWEPVWIENGTVTIDPVVLANRAIVSMNLDPITIGIVPESGANRVGLVGLPVWMWVDNQTANTWGPITRSASEGPVSVTATATVSSVIWNMGDGTKVNCTGPGTPYADNYGKQESPTCGHRYAMMSTDQPDGAYQVTATSHWVVAWSGAGQSGIIELDLTTNPLPIRVGEGQVLTQ